MTDEEAPPEDPEHTRWTYEQNRTLAERMHDRDFTLSRQASDAAIGHANFALRTLIIINGGAAIALLAFLGSLLSAEGNYSSKLSEITAPLVSFSWGIATATVSIGFAYFTTYCIASAFSEKELTWDHPWTKDTPKSTAWTRASNLFQVLAVVLALVSLYFFISGMLDARDAIISANPLPQGN